MQYLYVGAGVLREQFESGNYRAIACRREVEVTPWHGTGIAKLD